MNQTAPTAVVRRPPAELPRLQALATQVMESAMSFDVPLKVDVKIGADWAAV